VSRGAYRFLYSRGHTSRHDYILGVFLAAGNGQSLRHDLLGTEYSRVATDADIVGQHSPAAATDRRKLQRRLRRIRMARRSMPYICQEVLQGLL